MKIQYILAIVIIAAFAIGAAVGDSSVNRWVDLNGAVHYNHPTNAYQVAVEELNNYVPVYEQQIPDNEIGNVVGQTWFQGGKAIQVLIEQQDPAVVYHEMGHVIMNGGSEPDADAFAASKGYYIHDGTY